MPLVATERSSCTFSYRDPAFPHLKFHETNAKRPLTPSDVHFSHLWLSSLTAGHM